MYRRLYSGKMSYKQIRTKFKQHWTWSSRIIKRLHKGRCLRSFIYKKMYKELIRQNMQNDTSFTIISIYGIKLLIVTDKKPLESILKIDLSPPRLQRIYIWIYFGVSIHNTENAKCIWLIRLAEIVLANFPIKMMNWSYSNYILIPIHRYYLNWDNCISHTYMLQTLYFSYNIHIYKCYAEWVRCW